MSKNTEETGDEELVTSILKGDKELFGEIVDRYEDKLTRYIRRFIQHNDDVSDILQIVFIKAYTNLQSFDIDRSFNSWIYRIAHNESVTHLKKKGNSKVSFIDFDTFFPHPNAKETADKDTLSHQDKEALDKSLSKISPKYREVLVLYYYEEFSYSEIADILHIPIATVGVRIKRGKDELRKNLVDSTGGISNGNNYQP